jgi:hypothetical protein
VAEGIVAEGISGSGYVDLLFDPDVSVNSRRIT